MRCLSALSPPSLVCDGMLLWPRGACGALGSPWPRQGHHQGATHNCSHNAEKTGIFVTQLWTKNQWQFFGHFNISLSSFVRQSEKWGEALQKQAYYLSLCCDDTWCYSVSWWWSRCQLHIPDMTLTHPCPVCGYQRPIRGQNWTPLTNQKPAPDQPW